MSYKSVDEIQKVLQIELFGHLQDSKKAAGRALGTLVEIITFYLLKAWGLNDSIQIEKSLREYGNWEIHHNIEFSLHPVLNAFTIEFDKFKPTTSHQILNAIDPTKIPKTGLTRMNRKLIDNGVLRNGCLIAADDCRSILCSLENQDETNYKLRIYEQINDPYAIVECKRVGIEEGCKKGPQTIEKAKQGAYVARTTSSLQKVRTNNGDLNGIIFQDKGKYEIGCYFKLMERIINSEDMDLLRYFILSVGIVSNHGNWFSSDNQNKELKVLAQSYDWLLFLTDSGLTQFVLDLLVNSSARYKPVREAFLSSYQEGKKRNQFTKVTMNYESDLLLQEYFRKHINKIEGWFNIVAPRGKSIVNLKDEISILKNKKWEVIK